MTVGSLNRTFVGFSTCTFRRLSDNLIMSFPPPQSLVVDPVEQVREQLTRNNQGKQARAQTYSVGSLPTMTCGFGTLNPEMIAFRLGKSLDGNLNIASPVSVANAWPYQLRVTKGEYAAAASGYLGFGVTANAATTYASAIRNGVSTPLTRDVFASYSTWRTTDNKFGIGADGALNFSDNLVTNRDIVTLLIPQSLTGNKISELPAGAFEFKCTMVDTLGQVSILTVFNCEPNPASSAIDFSAESVEVIMNVNAAAGTCDFFDLIQTPLTVGCI